MKTTVRTPWGKVTRIEEVSVPQRAGDHRFSTVVQLLEDERGERRVRGAYTTEGVGRRGPVTLRRRDLERLWTAMARAPALRAALVPEAGDADRGVKPAAVRRAAPRTHVPP